jgi:hypothetical protein
MRKCPGLNKKGCGNTIISKALLCPSCAGRKRALSEKYSRRSCPLCSARAYHAPHGDSYGVCGFCASAVKLRQTV